MSVTMGTLLCDSCPSRVFYGLMLHYVVCILYQRLGLTHTQNVLLGTLKKKCINHLLNLKLLNRFTCVPYTKFGELYTHNYI